MKKTLIACVISTLLLAGCGPKTLSPEEQKQVDSLKAELSSTEGKITDSQQEEAQYSGGLIKSLLKTKTEILETNKALIQQRIHAIEAGTKIDVSVSSVKPNPEVAESIRKDIDTLKSEISSARSDAAQYSGGLVLAIKMSAVATQEQTLAMLEQRYLSAKYGLQEIIIPVAGAVKPAQQLGPVPTAREATLPAGDGPFGLQEGLSQKNIEDMTGEKLLLTKEGGNVYFANSVPKQNDYFEKYFLFISPKAGLCQIRAIGKNVSTDSYGIALKSTFNEVAKLLDSVYGKNKTTDFLLSGSIWKDPQDWMMGLNKKERALMAEWPQNTDAMKRNKLTQVGIVARATSAQDGYIALQYTFSNDPVCVKESEDARKSSL